jgi:hypothetical protein
VLQAIGDVELPGDIVLAARAHSTISRRQRRVAEAIDKLTTRLDTLRPLGYESAGGGTAPPPWRAAEVGEPLCEPNLAHVRDARRGQRDRRQRVFWAQSWKNIDLLVRTLSGGDDDLRLQIDEALRQARTLGGREVPIRLPRLGNQHQAIRLLLALWRFGQQQAPPDPRFFTSSGWGDGLITGLHATVYGSVLAANVEEHEAHCTSIGKSRDGLGFGFGFEASRPEWPDAPNLVVFPHDAWSLPGDTPGRIVRLLQAPELSAQFKLELIAYAYASNYMSYAFVGGAAHSSLVLCAALLKIAFGEVPRFDGMPDLSLVTSTCDVDLKPFVQAFSAGEYFVSRRALRGRSLGAPKAIAFSAGTNQ